jgi:hypothetical protein
MKGLHELKAFISEDKNKAEKHLTFIYVIGQLRVNLYY